MKKKFIYDKSIEINDKKKIVDSYGYIIYKDVVVAREGSQSYLARELGLDSDEIIEVLRPSDEVRKSVNSLNGKFITNNHPNDLIKFGDISLAIGSGFNARFKDGRVIADLIFYKEPPENKEISLGYLADIMVDDKGNYYQSNIDINHIAIVEKGRCGGVCKIVDSIKNKNNVILDNVKIQKGENMAKITIGDKSFEVDSAVAGHIEALNKKVEDMEKASKEAYNRAVKEINDKAKVITLAKSRKIELDDTKPLDDIKKELVKSLGYDVVDKEVAYLDAIIDIERTKKVEDVKKVNTKTTVTIDWDSIASAEIK